MGCMRALQQQQRSLDRELLALTNDFRTEEKLPPLQWHAGLARAAKRHAELVAEGRAPFSHSGAPERFAQCGAQCINVGENLARSDGFGREDLPGAAMSGWVDSPGHRRNLLGPFDTCGIGWAASDSGTVFVTQLLALLDPQSDQASFRVQFGEVAFGAASSTPAVCAAMGLAFTGGPLLALTSGLVGGVLELRYGVKLASAPRALRDRANNWLRPATCSVCGAPAEAGSGGELLATSAPPGNAHGNENGDTALVCERCHPSPADDDLWCYLT